MLRYFCNVSVKLAQKSNIFENQTHRSCLITNLIRKQNFTSESSEQSISRLEFEKISDETLESLSDYFDNLCESYEEFKSADCVLSDGVLSFVLPQKSWVINRQVPNRQIWLSSPISGPKRYDFCRINKKWIYKHDGKSLHRILSEEFQNINSKINFEENCTYGR